MNRIVVDQQLRDLLVGLDQEVELCDDDGNVIAIAWPLTPEEIDEPPIDLEEVKRNLSQLPHISTKELLERLRKM